MAASLMLKAAPRIFTTPSVAGVAPPRYCQLAPRWSLDRGALGSVGMAPGFLEGGVEVFQCLLDIGFLAYQCDGFQVGDGSGFWMARHGRL
eukprot:gene8337-biopygen5690